MHLAAISLTSTDWPVGAIPQEWVEKLFKEMSLTFGKKFADQWGGVNPVELKKHWALKMGELTDSEMVRGVKAMRELDWPPTLNEFLKLCKPSIDKTIAYYEAINGLHARDRGEIGQWSHPAIFWAASKLAFDLKNLTYSAVKARWEKELSDELDAGAWREIPKPALQLAAPGKTQLSRDKAKEMLQSLGASGVLKPNRVDPKAWAKRILQRHAEGDNSLMPMQIKFAQEALA